MHKSHFSQGTAAQNIFYKMYTNKLTKLKAISKKLHYGNEFRSCAGNPRMLWETLNNVLPSKRPTRNSAPKVLKINGVSFDHSGDIAHSFNSFFCSIGQSFASQVSKTQNAAKPLHYLHNRVANSFFLAPSHPQEILRTISSLRNSSFCGPDNILIYRLTIFFNFCGECGIFPDSLTTSKIISVFKSGDKTDLNNYRLISLLPVIAKVFEKL